MTKKTVGDFYNEAKQEWSKITWSSRRDVTMTTVMVLIMVSIIAVFFLLVDTVIYKVVQTILGF